jgi:UDP:flavonoid glycosyltransferase YjiC (YdhE family)
MKAKKILVMPDGNWLAHVSRPFEIAKRLREMGYEVTFAGNGEYMKLPRRAGLRTLAAKTIAPDRVLECVRRGRTNPYDYDLLKELVCEELRLFDKIEPDLVLGDFRPSLGISCQAAEIPLAVTINAAWTNYSSVKIRSIEHSGLGRMARGVLGRRLPAWLGLAERMKRLIIAIDSFPYRRLRREMGLGHCRNMCDVLEGDLNLLADIPEYGPTNHLPAHFNYIGPIIWEPEARAPSWLDNLSHDRPTLYLTMGSTCSPRFFHEAVEVFANTRYQCIMTTGGMMDIKNPPSNFFVTDYAPGSKIMRKSDVVICHGGNGTLYQAMSAGVPIIGIPTMHDQEINMQRVVDLGIGIQLSELAFEPSHLAEAITRILTEESYKEKVQRLKRIVARYRGSRKGAELINSYLAANDKQMKSKPSTKAVNTENTALLRRTTLTWR